MLPKEAFDFQYPVAGDPNLANEISEHLRTHGFEPVLDENRGLDHAVYVPMSLMRPAADIPIVQMSVLSRDTERNSTQANIKLGQALECFRDKSYAIVGSGGSFHDFHAIAAAFFEKKVIPESSRKFERFLESVASVSDPSRREARLVGWRELPESFVAHPPSQSEHLMPFMVISGSGGNCTGKQFDMYEYRGAPMGQYEW
jgi:aromatic ring-opening dioxygenase catalytic subunit (LigB family)